jgi:hypothetical protein
MTALPKNALGNKITLRFAAPTGGCPKSFPDPADWASFCDPSGWEKETDYGSFEEWFRRDAIALAQAATSAAHADSILRSAYTGRDALGVGVTWAIGDSVSSNKILQAA